MDHGPEYVSADLLAYCEERGVELDLIEPGKPHQNAYVERFNRTFREDVLDTNLLISLDHAQTLIEELREDYNRYHPHSSFKDASPLDYREAHETSPTATQS